MSNRIADERIVELEKVGFSPDKYTLYMQASELLAAVKAERKACIWLDDVYEKEIAKVVDLEIKLETVGYPES